MARDAYANVHDNLRSVGLAVQYLRGLDRHGGGHMMERAFDGFAALPPSRASQSKNRTPWWRILDVEPDSDFDTIRNAYLRAAKMAHPDGGGSTETFNAVHAAYEAAKQERKDQP